MNISPISTMLLWTMLWSSSAILTSSSLCVNLMFGAHVVHTDVRGFKANRMKTLKCSLELRSHWGFFSYYHYGSPISLAAVIHIYNINIMCVCVCSRPAAMAVIALAFGQYILEPLFMPCVIPPIAVKLATTIGLSMYTQSTIIYERGHLKVYSFMTFISFNVTFSSVLLNVVIQYKFLRDMKPAVGYWYMCRQNFRDIYLSVMDVWQNRYALISYLHNTFSAWIDCVLDC